MIQHFFSRAAPAAGFPRCSLLVFLLPALPACSSPAAFHQRRCDLASPDTAPTQLVAGQASSLPEGDGQVGNLPHHTLPAEFTWDAKVFAPDAPLSCLDRLEHVGAATCDLFTSLVHDYENFYLDGTNLALLAGGLAVAAPIANTHADTAVRDWYQGRVRSPNTDHWSADAKEFGDHLVTIPIYLGALAGGALLPDTAAGPVVEDWASRTLRGLAVGAPAVGIGQIGLGSGRPGMGASSHWSPGSGVHGVAGHAFVGAMPFLTAAAMTDSPWLKAPLVAASFATGWSRINDDDHYPSQVILGWWIAYLSVRSVSRTERQRPRLHFCPCTAAGPGVGILLEH